MIFSLRENREEAGSTALGKKNIKKGGRTRPKLLAVM